MTSCNERELKECNASVYSCDVILVWSHSCFSKNILSTFSDQSTEMYDNPAFRKDEGEGEEVHPPQYSNDKKTSRFPSPPRVVLNDVTEISDEVINNNETIDQPQPIQSPER